MPTLTLTKHQGAGNDFLVLLGPEGGGASLDAAKLARAVCDRRLGIGADGLLIGRGQAADSEADIAMELRNADGSRAELSGNGIRCFVQAVLGAGLADVDRVRVRTDSGVREVVVTQRVSDSMIVCRVDMGPVLIVGADERWRVGSVEAVAVVDAGNPHVVLLDREGEVADVTGLGPKIDQAYPGGTNVEWIWPARDGLGLRVWERGAGETLACGTGSCAAAVAAAQWGLVSSPVTVYNPGGPVMVEIGETVALSGPAQFVATVEFPWP